MNIIHSTRYIFASLLVVALLFLSQAQAGSKSWDGFPEFIDKVEVAEITFGGRLYAQLNIIFKDEDCYDHAVDTPLYVHPEIHRKLLAVVENTEEWLRINNLSEDPSDVYEFKELQRYVRSFKPSRDTSTAWCHTPIAVFDENSPHSYNRIIERSLPGRPQFQLARHDLSTLLPDGLRRNTMMGLYPDDPPPTDETVACLSQYNLLVQDEKSERVRQSIECQLKQLFSKNQEAQDKVDEIMTHMHKLMGSIQIDTGYRSEQGLRTS